MRAALEAAARTDARVGKVLEFYTSRLAEPDRYLLAAVSLFARPVPAEAVLAVAAHEVFGSRLAGWTPAMVQAAVTGRLGGLASWHPDGTISAHPLVRDAFRRLVMDAAGAAAETSLAGLPAGPVTSRADALRVVEAIELLLDADQWQPAQDIYMNRSGVRGAVWKHLPAARLGQRAATAFVATPARRDACAAQLGRSALGVYLTSAGLWAANAGDLAAAREYLFMAIRDDRETGNMRDLSIDLQNLADCLGHLGQPGPARDAAAKALTSAQAANDREEIRNSHAYLGWVAGLADDAAEAERHFTAADQIEVADSPVGNHMYSLRGVQWAEWLARTGREGPARALTERNAEISRGNHWNEDVARCDWMLGRLARAAGDTTAAGEHLAAAAGSFRAATTSPSSPSPWPTSLNTPGPATTWTLPTGTPPRRSPSPPPAGWCPPRPPPWQSGPASAPARRPPPRTRTCCTRAATPPTPRCGWLPGTSWPGTNWTHCAPTPPSTAPRIPTGDGPPKPGTGMPGWSHRAWTRIRWPPWNGWSLPRKRPKTAGRAVSTDRRIVD